MVVTTPAFVIPPPRSPKKFIVSPSRWSFPRARQLRTRIISNLLYFQTNYILFNLICFVPFVIFSMKTVIFGAISIGIIIASVLFFREHLPQARQIKQDHPTIVIIGGLVLVVLAWRSFHTLLFIAAALIAPTPLWVVHASLRSSDKLSETGEKIAYAQTPMGFIMRMCFIEPKLSDHE